MASITKTQSGTWKAQVRSIGLPAVSKTFNTKHEAEVWSRSVQSEQDRGVFVNRSEAVRVTVGELIDRYIQEITPQKRSAKNDKQRMPFLKRHFGHFIVSQIHSKDIAACRDKRLAEGRQGAAIGVPVRVEAFRKAKTECGGGDDGLVRPEVPTTKVV